MALHSLYCADVPLRNCSLTHPPLCGQLTRCFSAVAELLVSAEMLGRSTDTWQWVSHWKSAKCWNIDRFSKFCTSTFIRKSQ